MVMPTYVRSIGFVMPARMSDEPPARNAAESFGATCRRAQAVSIQQATNRPLSATPTIPSLAKKLNGWWSYLYGAALATSGWTYSGEWAPYPEPISGCLDQRASRYGACRDRELILMSFIDFVDASRSIARSNCPVVSKSVARAPNPTLRTTPARMVSRIA